MDLYTKLTTYASGYFAIFLSISPIYPASHVDVCQSIAPKSPKKSKKVQSPKLPWFVSPFMCLPHALRLCPLSLSVTVPACQYNCPCITRVYSNIACIHHHIYFISTVPDLSSPRRLSIQPIDLSIHQLIHHLSFNVPWYLWSVDCLIHQISMFK